MSDSKRTENEAVFRAANERLKDRLAGLEENGKIPFICECSDANCLQAVELPMPIYEDVRAQGQRHFFVLPGHNGEGEEVVGEGDGFVIVEKFAGDGVKSPSAAARTQPPHGHSAGSAASEALTGGDSAEDPYPGR